MTKGVDMLAEIQKAWELAVGDPGPVQRLPIFQVSEVVPRGSVYLLEEYGKAYVHPEDAESLIESIEEMFPGTSGGFTARELREALARWRIQQELEGRNGEGTGDRSNG